MNTIKDLFDKSREIDRNIESVVTFADNTPKQLESEIKEYVVTSKLDGNYDTVINKIEEAFTDTSNEVGIWVSGFYGSGKSSFAKYLGYSFQESMILPDGISFGEKLMNKMSDPTLKTLHRTIIQKFHPIVIMIDLSTQSIAGNDKSVSDIMYYETLKLLGINAKDTKLIYLDMVLHEYGKYDEFCELIKKGEGKDWQELESKSLIANLRAKKYVPQVLPDLFPDADSFTSLKIDEIESEEDRFKRLHKLVKDTLGKEEIIYVLDELGQYVASEDRLILNMQGTMQILKSQFKGKVWVIATAQQTLTEDNPSAQFNSASLFKLNDRFPIKVDIEADDIKEIITRRLLGKSQEGKSYLLEVYAKNESTILYSIKLSGMEKSIYLKPISSESFANLYPFLPVHIDILMALLQKLASRTGGVGLRSVIRLIRDILVENKFKDKTIGAMATPAEFYDVLRNDMETNSDYREIVTAAKAAITRFQDDELAVQICKTIAVMQILDDFSLTLDNLCALLYNKIGESVDKNKVHDIIEDIKRREGLTLQEVEGRYRFMTNAILNIQIERNRLDVKLADRVAVLKEIAMDMFTPSPSAHIFGTKSVSPSVDLIENRKQYPLITKDQVRLNVRFINAASYENEKNYLLHESTESENKMTIYWLCSLAKDKDAYVYEIVRDKVIYDNHRNETNKEIQDYLKAQKEDEDSKRLALQQLLIQSQDNSEIIFRGTPQQATSNNYRTLLKSILEKIYSKFSMAKQSMPSSAVDTIARYDNLADLPSPLNPFSIIASDGTINNGYVAFGEVKDFISSHENVSGSEVLEYFDKAPYGWSKDTTRYLVALMLKANMIIIRSGAQEHTILSTSAANAMRNNTSFGHVGISINTNVQLTVPELLTAIKNLKSLFNPVETIAPSIDSIAKVAKKYIATEDGILGKARKLCDIFRENGLAGVEVLEAAYTQAKHIDELDGQDAPFLLAKDDNFYRTIDYVNAVSKNDETSHVLSTIKWLKRKFETINQLNKIPQLGDFFKAVDALVINFNELRNNSECFSVVSEYNDLKSQLSSLIEKSCIGFYTDGSQILAKKKEAITDGEKYHSLKDEQKETIKSKLDKIHLNEGKTLDDLKAMIDRLSSCTMYGGDFDQVNRLIDSFIDDNGDIPDSDSESGESGAHEPPTGTTKKIMVKRHMTSRQELTSLIDELKSLLDNWQDNTSLDIDVK